MSDVLLKRFEHPDEVREMREYVRSQGSDIQIIAKIEKGEALACIDAIIEAADGLMVATIRNGNQVAIVPVTAGRDYGWISPRRTA